MQRSLGLISVLLGACLSKPDPPEATSDACLFDSFDSGISACLPWGFQYGNAVSASIGGDLVIRPQASFGRNSGGCRMTGMSPLTDGGVFIEMSEVPSAASGQAKLIVSDDGRSPTISYSGGFLQMETTAGVFVSMAYSAAAMRWWRLRADSARNKLVGEYSANGAAWNHLGEINDPPPMLQVQIEAGVSSDETTPGAARIGQLHVCPP